MIEALSCCRIDTAAHFAVRRQTPARDGAGEPREAATCDAPAKPFPSGDFRRTAWTARPDDAQPTPAAHSRTPGEPSCSIDALMLPLAVFIGAGIGGLARYGISVWLQAAAGAHFPWGTLLVNVSGSLLLAFVYVLLEGTSAAPEWRAFLGVGVLGGYTTFSTFSFETMRLLQDGLRSQALFYVAGSVVLSLAGALLGFRLASLVLRQG